MEWLMNKENIGEILTTQYDIALNGLKLGVAVLETINQNH